MSHDKDALLREAVKLIKDEWDGTRPDSEGNALIARITAALAELQEENKKLLRDLDAEEAEHAEHVAQPEQEPDAAHLQTIDERDAAEEAVSDIYYRITGRSPEWSNLFGFEHAIEEIQDAFDLVRAVAKSSTAPQSGVREGMLRAAEIVRNGRFLHDQSPAKLFANAAAAIERAAEQVNAEGQS